jgi:hypothetical protein
MEQARPAASVEAQAFAPVVTAKDEAFEPESAIDEIWSGAVPIFTSSNGHAALVVPVIWPLNV